MEEAWNLDLAGTEAFEWAKNDRNLVPCSNKLQMCV